MPDILPVSMQDILYSRKSDLRKQKISFREAQENKGERQRFFMTAALCMSKARALRQRLARNVYDKGEHIEREVFL